MPRDALHDSSTLFTKLPRTGPQPNAALCVESRSFHIQRRSPMNKAGATSVMEPADRFYGDRCCGGKDCAGKQWFLATRFAVFQFSVLKLLDAELFETHRE